jgi:glycerol kinase
VSRGVLALDQGSHASRACIFDEAGVLCATATVPVATLHPGALQVEQDAAELVQSLRTAAQQACAAARRSQPQLQLAAAGLAVQRSTIVCCDRSDGTPLAPAISWQDRRNAAWLASLAPHEARIRELTGLPLSAHYGASKIRWCVEHLPSVVRAAATGRLLAAPLASYLALQLAGTALADPANASRTLLFDSQRLDWSDELLGMFAIERAWLPRCAPTRGAWGTLRLADGAIELRAVTGDQSAVPYATGAPDTGTVYVNLGTGAFVQRPLALRPASPAPLLGSVLSCDADGALYSLEGTVNGAGSAVSEFCARQNCAEAELWLALESLPGSAALPVFVNGVGGLGSPWWRADLQSRFIGPEGTAGPAPGATLQCFAAVVESIAFMITANARLLAQQSGPPQRVLLAGGISRSAWLCRRLAALLELPVQVLDAEASARGVACLAAPQLTAQWPTALSATWEPEPDPALAARYRQFIAAIGTAA